MKKKFIIIILIIVALLSLSVLIIASFKNNSASAKDKKIIQIAENYLIETGNNFEHEGGIVTYLSDNKAQVDFSELVPEDAQLRPKFKIVKVDLTKMKAFSIESR